MPSKTESDTHIATVRTRFLAALPETEQGGPEADWVQYPYGLTADPPPPPMHLRLARNLRRSAYDCVAFCVMLACFLVAWAFSFPGFETSRLRDVLRETCGALVMVGLAIEVVVLLYCLAGGAQ